MMITVLSIGAIILAFLYAILSIYLRKVIGVYIAAACHIFIGILSLPSIGLYIILLAIIEIGVGMYMMLSNQKQL